MFPVVAAIVIGGILYLVSQDSEDSEPKVLGSREPQKGDKPKEIEKISQGFNSTVDQEKIRELRKELRKELKKSKRNSS